MNGIRIEAATRENQDAVRTLCQNSLLAADTRDGHGLDRLLWGTGAGAPVRVVARDADGVAGAAFASSGVDKTGLREGYHALIAVRPDCRRRGIAQRLVRAVEVRLADAGAVGVWTGGSQPRYWWPGIDPAYGEARELFVSEGYQEMESVSNMTVRLDDQALDDASTTDVTIRRLTAAEFPAFQRWMRSSWDGVWDQELALTLTRAPVSCFVAQVNDEYVGFAGYDSNRLGWFGPMGSMPSIRGRGVGASLLRSCLRDYRDRGDTRCEIAWIGPEKFYREAVGAQLGRTFDRLWKALAP